MQYFFNSNLYEIRKDQTSVQIVKKIFISSTPYLKKGILMITMTVHSFLVLVVWPLFDLLTQQSYFSL